MNKQQIAVIGGGSWGTALIKILCKGTKHINWWLRNPDDIKHIRQFRHNRRYLSSVRLMEENLQLSSQLDKVIFSSDVLIFAVPSAFLKDVMRSVKKESLENKIIFSAVKGMVPGDNLLVGEYFHQYFEIPLSRIGVIAGPCHAEEVALEKLSYITVASQDAQVAKNMAKALRCRYVRTICSDDIYGTEYAAVLKNVVSVASGICRGLGYGDNFQAVLISNAIREIKRFVDKVHPIDRDIKDSAYLGDLLVTAYSQFSRNRTFGTMVGKGYSVKSAMMEMGMIAEGYYAVKCIKEVNKKYGVKMPISDAVFNILYEKISPMIEINIMADELD